MSENQDPSIPPSSGSPSPSPPAPMPLSESASEPAADADPDASAAPSAAASDPDDDPAQGADPGRSVVLVDELRLIGIVCPLGSVIDVYIDSSTEDPVHNVAANTNLAVRALLYQGDLDLGDAVLEAAFGDTRIAQLLFKAPFNIVDREARNMALPPGFRGCFVGIRPRGTVEPGREERHRDDFPPAMARRVMETWQAWGNGHITVPFEDRPLGVLAWPILPYCSDGMEFEILQELEEDSL
ncbi:hypothetical protein ACHAPJ_010097 [Fusarium lateritium]